MKKVLIITLLMFVASSMPVFSADIVPHKNTDHVQLKLIPLGKKDTQHKTEKKEIKQATSSQQVSWIK
mgnify:CR=1 FL=1